MKRLLVLMVAVSFVFCGSVFASEASKAAPVAAPAKAAPVAAPAKASPATLPAATAAKEMSITGKVTEISDAILKIEHTVKGKPKIMEFTLEKPVKKIKAGIKVEVNYIIKDGKNIANKVTQKDLII